MYQWPVIFVTESARAVTGRRCPHSAVGRGKTFWRVNQVFVYENGHNSGTKSRKIASNVGNVGHFFDGLNGSTKFRWKRSKTKGTYYSELTQAQNGENRGESRKMTHSSETEFFSGWSEWKVVAPGPVDKNQDNHVKNWLGPKYPNFGVEIAHFCP